MTPKQALELLTQATGLLQLTRADHAKIQVALKVIDTEIVVSSERANVKKVDGVENT